MAKVFAGRYTAEFEGSFVVFLIGMRVNRLRAIRKWLPTALAMGPMLRTLYQHPQKGFLGGMNFRSGRTVLMVQYWRSFEDLERFARDREDPHLAAWRRFNRVIGSDGSVGVFHESYLVPAGHFESIYANMPLFGLAAAARHVPITGRRNTARERVEQPPNDVAQPAEQHDSKIEISASASGR